MGSRSMNKVMLLGNLGRDPEVRYTASGKAMATFSLAKSMRWKDQDGNDQERTEWHRVVAWGRLGEICGQYLGKGRQVFVEGRIQSRDWEDQDGNKRTTFEIVANDVFLLGGQGAPEMDEGPSRDRGQGRQSGYQQGRGREGSNPPADRKPGATGKVDKKPVPDEGRYGPPPPEDDIPF
jgi:single-strand DNA-binding protein